MFVAFRRSAFRSPTFSCMALCLAAFRCVTVGVMMLYDMVGVTVAVTVTIMMSSG
jgi:hypothetical protein